MAGRPLQLRICGQPFKVDWGNRLSGTGKVGLCEISDQTLHVLAESMAPHQERDTVLHEVIHALIGMTSHEEDFKAGGEERVVCSVSTALLAVLRENPRFVVWLTEKIP